MLCYAMLCYAMLCYAMLSHWLMGHKGTVNLRPTCIGTVRSQTQSQINQSIKSHWLTYLTLLYLQNIFTVLLWHDYFSQTDRSGRCESMTMTWCNNPDDLIHHQRITVQLTFLSHSGRMRPNFQGLPWFECYEIGEMNY